jgi:hypothetical protein
LNGGQSQTGEWLQFTQTDRIAALKETQDGILYSLIGKPARVRRKIQIQNWESELQRISTKSFSTPGDGTIQSISEKLFALEQMK